MSTGSLEKEMAKAVSLDPLQKILGNEIYRKNLQVPENEHFKLKKKSRKNKNPHQEKSNNLQLKPLLKKCNDKTENTNHDEASNEQTKNGELDEKLLKNFPENVKSHDSLAIMVHNINYLSDIPFVVCSPIVVVYVLHCDEGNLIFDTDNDADVNSNKTRQNPQTTRPFNAKFKRSIECCWEEELLFNIKIKQICDQNENILILFELKDFILKNGFSKEKTSTYGCLAWAFLWIKRSPFVYFQKPMQLQLYQCKKSNITWVDIYSWWKSGFRKKLSSSLIISLKGASYANSLKKAIVSSPNKNVPEVLSEGTIPTPVAISWSKKKHELCSIPNRIKYRLSTNGLSCMVVKFSNNGLKLACGTEDEIVIYDAIKGTMAMRLQGHLNIVYDICWTDSDSHLLSSSADSTARVWNIKEEKLSDIQILSHPSYVYCSKFMLDATLLISGCFDCTLRVWEKYSNKYKVVQELSVHLGYITSICISNDKNSVCSADKHGVIAVWHLILFNQKGNDYIQLERLLKLQDIYGEIINDLFYHPGGHRLVCQTRDSQIKLINIYQWTVTQQLQGHLNMKNVMKCCVSPCGSWVLSGSEDGCLYAWNADTAETINCSMDLCFGGAISCVDFHPFDNYISVCSFSDKNVILLLDYEQKGLKEPLSVKSVENLESNKDNEELNTLPINSTEDPKWDSLAQDIVTKLDVILALSSKKEPSDKMDAISSTYDKGFALYDYRSTAADEISVNKGECVSVIKRKSANWWLVEKDNKEKGLLPASYISVSRTASKRKKKTLNALSPSPASSKGSARARRHLAKKKIS